MKRTALYDEHVARGGKMVPFAGWDMPIQFTSIIEEHMSVRDGCGIFDVSHMGDLVIKGDGAKEAVDGLITNDLMGAPVGRCVYGHILREDGTILDDTIATPLGGDEVLVVPNAATTDKVREWFKGRLEGVELLDLSDSISTIAVQGPTAADAVGELTSADLSGLGSFRATFATLDGLGPAERRTRTPLLEGRAGLDSEGVPVLLSRTGYTGEDGFEIMCDNADAVRIWRALLDMNGRGVVPVGLGARDTLRLEKGLLLSGTDFDGSQTSLQTGPAWAVKWTHDFVGREALERQRNAGGYDVLVGMVLKDRGIPRHGYDILKGNEGVGHVTSGTLSPVMRQGIALGYVPKTMAEPGTELGVKIRDRPAAAEVVRTPFVRRKKR